MYDKNGLNKEIEDLKKKLEELEKASLNTAEKVLGKEEVKEEIKEEKIEEVKEVQPEEEAPKKGGLPYYALPLGLLAIVVAIMGIFITFENSSKDRKMASQSDDVRGYSIVNDHRVWWDENLYQKNQDDKSQCFYYQPQGDYDPVPVCPATKMDIQKAKERGSYIDDPDMDFSDATHIVAKPLTEEEKAEEAKSIDSVTLADANSTYISPDGNWKYRLKDGWIIENLENNVNTKKGEFEVHFFDNVGSSVDTIETNNGEKIVALTPWNQPEFSVVFKMNDPSSEVLMKLIKDQISKDVENIDKYSGATIVFTEDCGLWYTSAQSYGSHFYKELTRGIHLYLKTSAPLRVIKKEFRGPCKPTEECIPTYYIGK